MKPIILTLTLALLALSNSLTSAQAQNNGLSMQDVMGGAVNNGNNNAQPAPPPSNNSGITVNKSRQQMQQGYGSNAGCIWDGGHDMLGIPGVEVPVVCRCNGEIVSDSRCQ